MLISETTKTKWNSKTKKYYEEKGYIYNKGDMGKELEVKITDLRKSSKETIEVKCDYCDEVVDKMYGDYLLSRESIEKDCCNNEECRQAKLKESVNKKYGVDNYFSLSPFTGKNNYEFKDTNIECLNCGKVVHRSEAEINKYEKHFCCNECKKEYLTKNATSDESSLERSSLRYKQWRSKVISKNHRTCQCCGKTGGELEVHHIENFSSNEELRYEIDNGITFCKECHSTEKYGSFHNIYGTKNNNKKQLKEYIERNKNGDFDDLKKLNTDYEIPKIKACSRCKEVLSNTLEHFSKDKYSKDGLTYACKKCRNGYKKLRKIKELNKDLKEAI